jgi:Phosphotransferase enzyme family
VEPAEQDAATALTPRVRQWAARCRPGCRVDGCTTRPLGGGSVARRVERLRLHLAGGQPPLDLVRKDAPGHEAAGLRAAQAVRPRARAVPELVDWGDGWLVTPLVPGSPLDWGDPVPADVFDSLALLHARYQGGAGLVAAIPRITPAWWQRLCQDWVTPGLCAHAARHPPGVTARARALVDQAAASPAAAALLTRLPLTLLHGDVHPGNVIAADGRATLIDWGSSRAGPAALDLANLIAPGSPEAARYAWAWQQATGTPLPAGVLGDGFRWAALQIPVQYLPWTVAHRTTADVGATLDEIGRALGQLSAGDRRD